MVQNDNSTTLWGFVELITVTGLIYELIFPTNNLLGWVKNKTCFSLWFLKNSKKSAFYFLLENDSKYPYLTPYLAFLACTRVTTKKKKKKRGGQETLSILFLFWIGGPSISSEQNLSLKMLLTHLQGCRIRLNFLRHLLKQVIDESLQHKKQTNKQKLKNLQKRWEGMWNIFISLSLGLSLITSQMP